MIRAMFEKYPYIASNEILAGGERFPIHMGYSNNHDNNNDDNDDNENNNDDNDDNNDKVVCVPTH